MALRDDSTTVGMNRKESNVEGEEKPQVQKNHDEYVTHRRFHLTWQQSAKLWAANNISCFSKVIYNSWPGVKDLKTIYVAGNDKLMEHFDMKNVILDMKYVKTLCEYHLRPNHKEIT